MCSQRDAVPLLLPVSTNGPRVSSRAKLGGCRCLLGRLEDTGGGSRKGLRASDERPIGTGREITHAESGSPSSRITPSR
jgi:hypothetical protein